MQALAHRAELLANAGRLGRGQPDGPGHLLGVEPQERPDRHRRPEHADGACVCQPAL